MPSMKQAPHRCFLAMKMISSPNSHSPKYYSHTRVSIQCSYHFTIRETAFVFKIQFSSVTQSCPTLCDPHGLQHGRPPCPSPTPIAYSNLCPSSWRCHSTSSSVIPFSSHLQSSPASWSFSHESVLCIRWPKYWGFSFSISPSNECPGLISLRIDCFDLPAVQGTLKSLLQHHSSKASILWHSAFFIVQHSHPYMTIGKTIALTRGPLLEK